MSRFVSPRVIAAIMLGGVWIAGAVIASQRTASAMAAAATAFLESLSQDQRQQALLPYDSDEHLRWNFIPTDMFPRKGLPIRDMNPRQRALALDLLKTGLSDRGYTTASAIMAHEAVLKAIEEAAGTLRNVRDPELYFFTIFGTPSATNVWGWRVEGHHVSLHFDVGPAAAAKISTVTVDSTPTFFGANPADVPSGPKKGLRILGAEEDAGRALLDSLDSTQHTAAIIANVAPNEIVTRNAGKIDPLSPIGVAAADLSARQRDLLMQLIEVYTSKMTPDLASERLARLRAAGVEKIAFAWAGATDPGIGRKHYYRVQGPTFLIEFDNTQNDANHIHSVWRDFNGDFGRDLLAEHVTGTPH